MAAKSTARAAVAAGIARADMAAGVTGVARAS